MKTDSSIGNPRGHWLFGAILAFCLTAGLLHAQLQVAGTLYVNLRATDPSAGSATWTNQGALGNFDAIGTPSLTTNVASTGIPGVFFDGTTNTAYLGPNSVADIDGGGDRSIEVWVYNPALVSEETTISWGHRGTDRRVIAFNFGNNGTWGAATHWNDDVNWGGTPPSANAWHYLAYTYSNNVVRIYADGAQVVSKTLAGALNTFASEPINLACQREASGIRSLPFNGYLNTVRVHGGTLTAGQIQTNYLIGAAGGPTNPPAAPTITSATPGYTQAWLEWSFVSSASFYNLKRSTNSGGPFTTIAANLTGTNFLSTNLTTGVTYYFVISSVNLQGESTNSIAVSVTPAIPSQPMTAGTLYVDLRATNSTAGSATWANQGTLGDFTEVNGPLLDSSVAGTSIPGVFFDGADDAYQGPNAVADIAGASDRSIEVWTYNPTIVEEETMLSWGHRNVTRGNVGFNYGTSPLFGAMTHYADDVGWGPVVPTIEQWHHLVYTYTPNTCRVYIDGALANTEPLAGNLVTFTNEPINLACQRNSSNGTRSFFYSGYLNTVRIHGGVLNAAQIQANYFLGPQVFGPVASNDTITLNPGAQALIAVMANDAVSSYSSPTVIISSPPSSGTAVVKPGGKVLYTHNGGPGPSDQFTYYLQTLQGATSQVATVSITVTPQLRLPNITITVPNQPPPVGYQVIDAFPGLVFEDALCLRTPPGRPNHLFVAERRGIVSYVPDITAVSPTRQVFLNISSRVTFDNTGEGESGLLGLAFHPGFATNGQFFVSYTALGGSPAFDRLSRFTCNPTNLVVDTNSETILINVIDQGDPCNCVNNHNGSDIHFGPDGYLYMSMGDEGGQYNVRTNSQNIDRDFYSGILRIDVDKKPGSLEPTPHAAIPTTNGLAYYSIPPNNPFVGATNFFGRPVNTNGLRAEFYAVGLRHPWRFSIDTNGEVWVGDVGQDRYEEIDVVVPGGNYGWSYYEGTHLAFPMYGQPTLLTNPPPGLLDPLYEYAHAGVAGGDPQYKGNSISGGVVYHGGRIPELTGAYIFGDFESANLWALWRTNSSVVIQRIGGDNGMAAFGIDPLNGDVLIANYLENKVKRLVRTDASNSTFPTRLSDTGVFADLATLAPNPGIVNYEPIVAFWSDYAIKRRWFTIPDLTNDVTFATDANWSFPVGMKWIKHFDLETERGNPATKRRIETRVLVKTDTGTYGVSYKWNDAQTDAVLVEDGGTNFIVNVLVGGITNQQQWEIPSRAACMVCHTPIAGHALSFNTRELNQYANLNGLTGNQIETLSQAGYFNGPVPNVNTLPAFAHATNSSASLEYRVRSYLAVNCVQCHQAGGQGAASWDARPYLTLAQTRLINGILENNGGDPANKLVVPGDLTHSVLLRRVAADGFSRMPPLATHQLDPGSIALLTDWISSDTNRQDFAQWQISHFGSTNSPNAASDADPDGDGGRNYFEFLTGTDPQNSQDLWKLGVAVSAGSAFVSYPRVPNLGVLVEASSDLFSWSPWDVSGNQPFFSSGAGTVTLQGPLSQMQYFRARLVEP